MPRIQTQQLVLAVAEGDCISLYAVPRDGAIPATIERTVLELDRARVRSDRVLDGLSEFVDRHSVRRCDAIVLATGLDSIAQTLRVPVMHRRRLGKAVVTRLRGHAGGAKLAMDWRSRRGAAPGTLDVIIGAIEAELCYGLFEAFRTAGLRVAALSNLAMAIPAVSESSSEVRALVCERTTVIQVLLNGRLTACREVLIGRRDFEAAYRRPIITEGGSVSLDESQARWALERVGVPIGGQLGAEILPGIRADAVWPLISPVLQRLRREMDQTIGAARIADGIEWVINVLAAPGIPGLGEHLALEMTGGSPADDKDAAPVAFLSALRRISPTSTLDLRPAEAKWMERLFRPLVAASVCAGLALVGGFSAPREAQAAIRNMSPVAEKLQALSTELDSGLAEVRDRARSAYEDARESERLLRTLPPEAPVVWALKELIELMPPGVRLRRISFDAIADPPIAELEATCATGPLAASLAAEWVRQLSDGAFVAAAEIVEMRGGLETGFTLKLTLSP